MTLLPISRTSMRVAQAISAIFAMIFISLGYIDFKEGQLSSGPAIFSTFANYSAMLCAVFYVLALAAPLKLAIRTPTVWRQRAVDFVLVVALVVAGVLHADNRAVKKCAGYNTMFLTYHGSNLFRCGDMKLGILLTFVTAALFGVTLAMSFKSDSLATSNLKNGLAHAEEPSASSDFAAINTPMVVQSVMADAETRHPMLRKIRRGGRALQLVCSALALVAMVFSYRHYFTGQYMSPKATFVLLMAYTCTLYSLWHVLAVETLKMSRRPALNAERVVDAVLAIMLLLGGVLYVTSEAVTDCDSKNATFKAYHAANIYRCGDMGVGAVFAFVAVVMYFATFALSFLYSQSEQTNSDTADRV